MHELRSQQREQRITTTVLSRTSTGQRTYRSHYDARNAQWWQPASQPLSQYSVGVVCCVQLVLVYCQVSAVHLHRVVVYRR